MAQPLIIERLSNHIVTEGATATTLISYDISSSGFDDASYGCIAYVSAISSGNSNSGFYGKAANFKSISSTITETSNATDIFSDVDSAAGWNVDIDLSSDTIRVRVAGVEAANISWAGELTIYISRE